MKRILFIKIILLALVCNNIAIQSKDPISKILKQRHSGYDFDENRHLSEKQIKYLIKAAQSTPSAFNDQPWHFIICDKKTNPDAYNKALNGLVEFNQNWAKKAPLLIVIVSSTKFKNNKQNQWAQYDTGAAAYGLDIQATSLGLMTHQIGGFDSPKIMEAFSIPNDFLPMSIIAVGYESLDQKQRNEKKRKPIAENFFMGTWGLCPNA